MAYNMPHIVLFLTSKSFVSCVNHSESDKKMRSRLSLYLWLNLIKQIHLWKSVLPIYRFFKMTILISILLIHLVYSSKDVERHHRVGYSLPHSEETLKISVSSNLKWAHIIWNMVLLRWFEDCSIYAWKKLQKSTVSEWFLITITSGCNSKLNDWISALIFYSMFVGW